MNIFVGASARDEIDKNYLEEAKEVALWLSKKDVNLVYGCDDKGIMGVFYQAFLNKKIYAYNIEEYKNELKGNITMTLNTSERTLMMLNKAQMYLFMPGGIGTYQELFTALDIKKTYNSKKKIIIYNYHGIYNNFITLINRLADENFCDKEFKDSYIVCNTKEELFNVLEEIINE